MRNYLPASTVADVRRLIDDGIPYRQIAARLGISHGAAQHYARAKPDAARMGEYRAPGALVSDEEMARIYGGRRYQDVRLRRR